MSDKIDQRIVEMSFENQKFEKGISQSKNSLKEFSNALKDTDLAKDFSSLEKSVGVLANSFSAMSQIGIGALRRIGEAAINAGSRLIKSMTIEPAIAGMTKYEQKTAAVQTIMNATGKSIGEVNGYLDQLMWFSDETSYGFTDMTAALAQMTSSGGKIETLIPMITGVANATAFVGKGAGEFSRAMFNLNQSYGKGSLQNLDWGSLQLAGVAGKDLAKVFIDTGKALGTLDKNGRTAKGTLVNIGTFASSLQDKWANTKVMEKAFGKFSELSEAAYKLVKAGEYETAAEAMEFLAGKYSMIAEKGFAAAQTAKTFTESISATIDAVSSGWMRTYELMFGDLDEAKKNFTALTGILWTVFASGAKSRNEMLAWLKEFGGISNVFQGLKTSAFSLLTILKPISQAFDQIFPPRTKEQWLALTVAFKNFTAGLIIADSTSDKIRRTFAGLFAVIDIGWQVVKFLGNAAFELVKIFIPLGSSFLGTSASLGDLLVNINKAIKSSGVFQYGLLAVKIGVALLRDSISKIISVVSEFVTGLWNAEDPFEYLKNVGSRVFSGLIEGIKMVVSWISGNFAKAVKGVSDLFGGIFDESAVGIWPSILKILKEVVGFIGGKVVDGFQSFSDVIKNLDFNKIATFVVGGVLLIFISQLTELTKAMTGFTSSLSGAVNSFTKKFLKLPATGAIRDMAYAIGVLSASIWILSRIPATDLDRSLRGLAIAMGMFVGAYLLIQGINVGASKLMKDKDMATSAFGLTGVAAALLIMAVAVKTISTVDKTMVWNSTFVLGAMLGFITAYQLLAALVSMLPNQQKISANLFGMSFAILTLVGALKLLNLFGIGELKSSLSKLTSILFVIGALQAVFALAAGLSGGNKVAVSIAGMAIGIASMIGLIKLLSFIDKTTITQSVSNLALITLIIAGVEVTMGLAGRLGGGKKIQTNILAIQVGMLAMVGLIAIVGNMKKTTIDQGLINVAKMAGVISGIEVLTALSARIAGGAKVQRILGAVTFTLLSFTGVVAILGNMKQAVVDQGMITLNKMVGLISVIEFFTAMASSISGNAKMFSSLMGVSIAIIALAGSLALLSVIDQGFLREATISLAIASAAIVALSIAMKSISSAIGSMSKTDLKKQFNGLKVGFAAMGGILLLTASFFGLLGLILPIVKDVEWKDLGIFVAGLSAVTVLFAAFGYIGKQLTDKQLEKQFNGLRSGFATFGIVLLSTMSFFGVLALILPIVRNVNMEDIGKFIIGLGAITALFATFGYIGKQLTDKQLEKQFNGLKAGFAAMAGILLATASFFGLLGFVLPIVKQVEWKDLAIFLTAMSAIGALVIAFGHTGKQVTDIQLDKQFNGLKIGFIAMSGILLLTASLFGLLGFVLPTVKQVDWKDLTVFLAALGAVTLIIGGIALLGKSFETLGKGSVNSLKGIGIAIVGMAVVILATVGLALLMNALIPNAENLTQGLNLLVIVAAGIGRFIEAMAGGSIGANLERLGVSIANFARTLSTISFAPESLLGIKNLAEAVVLITGASILEGISRLTNFGTSPMETFGTQLSGLIAAINKVSTDDADKASVILTAMKPMIDNLKLFAEAAKAIPRAGGFVGLFLGDNITIENFGIQLAGLVNAFANVSIGQAIKSSVTLFAMAPMADNLKIFAEAAKAIPRAGGFVGDFLGTKNVGDFGTQLVAFVNAFALLTLTQVFHSSSILLAMTPMAGYLKTFAFAAQEIPSSASWLGTKIGGVKDIEAFGLKLASLVTTFGGLDETQLKLAISNLQKMNTDMLPNLKTFSEFTVSLTAYQGIALNTFGNDLRAFTETLTGADFTIVAPAMAAMDIITTSFQVLGATVLENARLSFENNKKPFQTVVASILAEPTQNLDAQKRTFVDKLSSIFQEVLDKGASYVEEFKTLGENIIAGLNAGIESKKTPAVEIIKSVVGAIIFGAREEADSNSPSRVFETLGGWFTLGLAKGIKGETDSAVKASVNMSKATEEAVRNTLGIHSDSTVGSRLGGSFVSGMGSGAKAGIPALVDAMKKIGFEIPQGIVDTLQNGTAIVLDAADSLGIDTGNMTIKGFISGIASTAGAPGGLTASIEALMELLDPNAVKAAAEAAGKDATDAYKDEMQTGLGDVQKVVKTELEKLKALFEEREFYGTITINEELKMLEVLHAKYKEDSEQRKLIDREIYSRLKTIYEAQIAYIDGVKKAEADAVKEKAKLKADYDKNVADLLEDADKKGAEIMKKHTDDAFDAQVAADKKLEKENESYNKDVTSIFERSEVDRQRLREQYATDQKSINEKLLSDIDAQNKAYESAVKSRADSIFNSYGLFAAVEPDTKITGAQLLKNLQGQSTALAEWKQSLADLAGRGVGDAMIQDLQAMGPTSKDQIKALLTLTDTQLTEYVGLFESKYSFARTKAEEELVGLKDSTALAIQGLNAQTAIDLSTLEAEFTTSMATIDSNMAIDMGTIRTTHEEVLAEIKSDLNKKLGEIETTWLDGIHDLVVEATGKMTDMKSVYTTSLSKINTDLTEDLTTMKTTFQTNMKTIVGLTEKELINLIENNKTRLAQLNTDTGLKLGEVAKTFGTGGTNSTTSFGSTLKDIIPNTISSLSTLVPAIKTSFDAVNSEFITAGTNAAAGFAQGIRNGSYLAVNAAAYLARSAVTSAEGTLNEKSPSKVFEGIGKFVSMGFANGIINYAYQAEKASEEMARGPIAAVSQALAEMEDSNDLSFTITPVIDLSGIRPNDISKLLKAPVLFGTASSKLAVETVQNGSRELAQTAQTNSTNASNNQSTQGATISLTQNNYSPVALSRLEIYRQTKNQLSAMKGMVVGT